jgi:hypothetical protein
MVTETMMAQCNLIQASIEEAINPCPITGKAINQNYCSLPNNRLELTAGSCIRSPQFVSLAAARRS